MSPAFRRAAQGALSLALLATVLALVPAAQAVTDATPTGELTVACGVPTGWETDEVIGDEAKPDAELWSSNQDVADASSRLDLAVKAEPDSYLTIVAHETEHQLYVVVDPDRYGQLTPAHRAQLADLAAPVKATVVPSCMSRQEMDAIHHQVQSDKAVLEAIAATHKDGDFGFIGYGYNFADGRAVVALPHTIAIETVASLEAQYDDQIELSLVGLTGRQDDGSPHYGGAGLDITSTPAVNTCTAGFAVDKGGGRWMTTAEHCTWVFGESVPEFYSGGKFYGWSESYWVGNTVSSSWNNAGGTASAVGDITMIGDGTQQYSRYIHVDPCCPSTRLVNAKGSPSTSISSACVSGSMTLAKCSVNIIGTVWFVPIDPVTLDPQNNLAWTAWVGRRTGVKIVQDGDSGAPVYLKNGSNGAKIIGSLFAADKSPARAVGNGWDTIWFSSRATVEIKLGATVATTCCNNDSW